MKTGGKFKTKKIKSTQPIFEAQTSFPVVGIGASAGGLEAAQELLAHLPADLGMAYVLIQHLDPDHESHFSDILSRATSMTVQEAKDQMELKSNTVYVIPASSSMEIEGGKLKLFPREKKTHGAPRSIDRFLSSLAKDLGNQSIGVILSGTGSDGSVGITEIKGEGGITFAQNESAKYGGMPDAAVATGCVDYTLSPKNIAVELTRMRSHLHLVPSENGESPEGEEAGDDYLDVLKVLKKSSGIDFSLYKKGTLQRRISRRMLLCRQESLKDYLKYLREQPQEISLLNDDLLINVTSFFRDVEIFEVLKQDVFPKIVKGRASDLPIRIWVPGCSTGEEAYSLAICLLEFLSEHQMTFSAQIFCTDVSEKCIEKARLGQYGENALAQISTERRRRFFSKDNGFYQISKTIREMCIFARHDVTHDPPFSQIDLISCRNLLIYLENRLQKRVLSLFHYALKRNGVLVLGISENIGSAADLFSAVNSGLRIFSKKLAPGRPHFDFTRSYAGAYKTSPPERRGNQVALPSFDLSREVDQAVAGRLAPTAVVVNEDLEIIQVRGRTGTYLEPAAAKAGELSHNLLKMARPGLLADLRAAIQKARREGVSVQKEGVRFRGAEGPIHISLHVLPLKVPDHSSTYYIVVFGENSAARHSQMSKKYSVQPKSRDAKVSRIEQLENELQSTQEYLQSLIDKEQSSNEELKSANEEILSSNEELQSTNEELETAKEELQSINEELSTLNDELQNRNQQLNLAVNDLNNLILSVRIPVLILTRDLKIRRIVPGAEKLVNLIPSDIGRPLTDLKTNIEFPEFIPLIRNVIDLVVPEERQIQDKENRWYSMWVRPYLTSDNKIDGAVISLTDIDSLKRARDYAQAIIETVREPLLVLDETHYVTAANRSFYEIFQTSKEDTEGRLFYRLGTGQWDIPEIRKLLEDIWRTNSALKDFEVAADFPKIGRKTMLLNARRIEHALDGKDLILLAIEDITHRKEYSESLLRTNIELEQFAYVASHDLQEPIRMVSSYLELLKKENKQKLDESSEQYIQIAIEGARRMKHLVEDLLSFSRTGREDLKFEPTDCAKVLERVLSDLSPVIKNTSAEITYAFLPTILASESLMGQIFQNLIGNALKYQGKQTPRIHISAREQEGEWEFCVADNGIGIDPKYSQKIFEIFQRLHPKERFEGTGIGLAMCKKIVERYGGRIWVISQLGLGSKFLFTIPNKRKHKPIGSTV